MKFGERLRKARQDKNLTQDTVAKHMIVSRQTISSWENEKTYPDITSLIKLSEYYDISLDLLLKEDNGMREYLRKKDLVKTIKPISTLLLVINIIFTMLIIGDLFDIIKLGIVGPFILIMSMMNISAIAKIDDLRKNLGIERKRKIKSFLKENVVKHFWIILLFSLLITIIGVFIFIKTLGNDIGVSIFSFGILIFVLTILIKKNKV
ncbi:helix-turn-helix domain-containing protein [Apilactobacillus timberlakei]|uniref:Helix-turn-helix domain-containing protein n=1 Tax=Apilactobacillus timberlakei TaxID=2008380 RepID=A0ABY2YSC3_9LACO|nr:helix-turn-helix transcriptional regulator [Apilactobacillus timberlakei]TPR12352.1 helix-turn-helix domain-containing protein [Apilactobacillus timberlakei]TPR12861.1 helix-turn-helix domain-containing protein [Apilactobacillus timberlakei]TPR14411.1 helix-turn-helix domain-containing protein [Apilactobacillus timberlakei]